MRKSQDGFTLIEMMIVIIIVSLLLGPLITFVNLYFKEKAERITRENLATLSLAMGQYFSEFGHYPCPSRLTAKNTDDDFGSQTECVAIDLSGEGGFSSSSSSGKGCQDGICTARGRRDGDPIKIGAVPHKVLGVPYAQTLDGYGNKITYAVTERYATSNPIQHLGAISIKEPSGTSVIRPEDSAQFIMISHGRDEKGSFSAQGVPNGGFCNSEPGIDNENCDGDSVFIDGQRAKASGDSHYDDIVLYKMFGDSLLWQNSPFDSRNIYNATFGNVGIGTEKPSEKLDIDGNLRAKGGLYTQEICDTNGENCFNPRIIGGSGMRCQAPDEVMIGIKDAEPVCGPVKLPKLNATQCPTDWFAAGIDLEGNIICQQPSWTGETQTIDLAP